MPSRNISWITEIWNNTDKDYSVWCWDTDNEGLYLDESGNEIGKNNDGQPVTIEAHSHVHTKNETCGVPDGGDRDYKPKQRVFFFGKPDQNFQKSVGPGFGLRLNRTRLDDDLDQIMYINAKTGEKIGRAKFPKGTEQKLHVKIEKKDGLNITVFESSTSTEAKFEQFVKASGKWMLDYYRELSIEAAKAAAGAAAVD
jgi:hypothetical protein